MRFLSNIRIRSKIILIIMLTNSIVIILLSASVVIYEVISYWIVIDEFSKFYSKLIIDNSKDALISNDQKSAQAVLGTLRTSPDITSAYLFTSDGRVFAKYLRGHGDSGSVSPELRGDASEALPEAIEEGIHFVKGGVYVSRGIFLGGDRIGTFYMRSDLIDLYPYFIGFSAFLCAMMLISGGLAFLVSSRLSRVISDPIVSVAKTIGTITQEKDYTLRASGDYRDEIGTLISGFNEMLEQIERRDKELQEHRENLEQQIAQRTVELKRRELAEESLKTSLIEKEILLKEIHHRVKNNLQIISSLINLQVKKLDNPELIKVLVDSQNRVRSMALIHEKLYRSQDLSHIDFAEYLRSFGSYLLRAYGGSEAAIELRVNAEDVALSLDAAISCGLIINELISNCLRHAFPGGRRGEIGVGFHVDHRGQYVLTVRDNGAGFPEDLDFRNTDSLGLQLVTNLTDQLDGTIELDRTQGTAFQITFPPAGGPRRGEGDGKGKDTDR